MRNRQFNLSTYIAIILITLVIVSTVTVSCFLYFSLSKSLKNEFEERVKAVSREISLSLASRVETIESRLRTLVNDNTVRVTLMLGAESQLTEHLTSVYSDDTSLNFFVQVEDGKKWISPVTQNSSKLEAWQALSNQSGTVVLSNDMSKEGFKLTLSLPITRQSKEIGLAAATYVFKDDNFLLATLERVHSCQIVVIDDGNAWDLMKGEISEIPLTYILGDKQLDAIKYIDTPNGRFAAIPDSTFPNVVILSSLNKLQEAKRSVLFSVMVPAIIIILLNLVISIIVSRRVVRPLGHLSEIAYGITQGNANLSFSVKESSIREFNKMSLSLSKMTEHLAHLREMERYQELFEGVADIVLIHDLQGTIVNANPIALTEFGMKSDELHLFSLRNIVSQNSYAQVLNVFDSLKKEGEQDTFSFSFINRAGQEISLECHLKRIVYNNMPVILNVARDMTERNQAEVALARSYDSLNTILDSIKATIVACDIENKEILFMNSQMKEIIGDDYTGQSCLSTNAEQQCFCGNKKCGDPGLPNVELPPWESFNSTNNKWYLNYDKFIPWVDGRLVKFQVAFDITEVKLLAIKQEEVERQLRKSQKMEAIGTLAGGVAHDLNNILSGIVSYPDLLLANLPEGSPLQKPLISIKESGLKASATVNDLLTLARRGVQIHEVVSLNNIVQDYLESPEHKSLMDEHRNVDIHLNLDGDLLNILGSPIHLSKTVMNLVKNGVESISGKGEVSIATVVEQVTAPPPNNSNIKSGEYVIITVTDNGSGISAKDSEKIFEPFFTTKIMGTSGTGLGMAVVWGTVEDHEGYIILDSTLGLGTTFKLYFPVTRVELLKELAVLSADDFAGNGELILVVDDIKEQREISSLMFNQLGYRVLTVTSGEEAIKYLSSHTVDLVILDMILEGGMGGLETYIEILKISPGQKAIVTSGYSETTDVKEAMRLGVGQYVKKPFLLNEIAEAIAQELESTVTFPL